MKKDAFMKELEYLLQDIPDEEKADAIAYYRDYLEEAGPEEEEEAQGFWQPGADRRDHPCGPQRRSEGGRQLYGKWL